MSHDSLHIEDTDIAIGAEIEENIISSISKPIDVSDYELFSISDASEEMDLDFSDVEPCATFSISDNFLKQEHVRVKNVLMMVNILTQQLEEETLIFSFIYFIITDT